MSASNHSPMGPTEYAQASSHTSPSPMRLDSESKQAGLSAVSRISQLATGGQLLSQPEVVMSIDMSSLVSAMRLSLDILTIKRLASPAIVKGCLLLIKITTDRRSGPTSPFSYEYERMCFRLLVVSLNVCLLFRWGKLDDLLEVPGLIQPEQAAYLVVDTKVPAEVLDQLIVADMGGNCDWVFGWFTTTQHPIQPLLLSQTDVAYLLKLLWDDRKNWLQAMISYANPGQSGLMFLFSRYVVYERDFQYNSAWETIRERVFELAVRYSLIADRDQLPATCAISDANAYPWHPTKIIPMHVDAEDSRTIMTSFIKRLSLNDDMDMIKRRDPTVMLRIVPRAADEACEDLLPEVIRQTIKYGWAYVIAVTPDEERLSGDMSDQFNTFVHMQFTSLMVLAKPYEFDSYSLSPSIRTQILDVVKQEDLLDWTIRMIIRLNGSNPNRRSDALNVTHAFFVALCKGVASSELEYYFLDYVPDWLKLGRHLQILGTCASYLPLKVTSAYHAAAQDAHMHILTGPLGSPVLAELALTAHTAITVVNQWPGSMETLLQLLGRCPFPQQVTDTPRRVITTR
ncbi:unnamed protein product [Rhizoctonia solani]|uniref:Uncharacterized protein n=1 Tax=Rhizoctonia solani TaxID=456999 RepID=A0A8H2WS23_9AGAM|nr:unnamed protein product [Rhizoctonia solani]